MGQTFEYPNLLVGTRSNPLSFYTIDKILVGMRMLRRRAADGLRRRRAARMGTGRRGGVAVDEL